MTAAVPAPGAQPGAEGGAAGQGQGAEPTSGLHPDLSNVPEGVRAQVESLLKEYDGNVTRKFQEAAEFRRQWEPYSQLGLNDVDPEELADLLAFREIANDPDAFSQWHRQIGEQFGLHDDDPDFDEESGGFDPSQLEDIIGRALDQRLGPIEQTFQQQQEQAQLQQAESFINSKLDELQEQHGEYDRDAVCQLALAYDGPDAVDRGFQDYQRLIGAAEQGVLKSKLDAPFTPEQGGRPGTAPQSITSFSDASAAAREMLKQSNRT